MRKIFVIISILLIVLGIASCGKESQPIVTPKQGSEGQQGNGADEPTNAEPGKVDARVQKMLDKARSTTNFYVSRNTLHEKPIVNEIYVKGNLQKYKLFDEQRYQAEDYFDTVYLDTLKKTAVAYCEDNNAVTCPNRDKSWTLNYNEVYTPNPIDWLDKIDPTTMKIISSETLDKRPTSVVSAIYKGKTTKIWMDTFSGIPLRIEVGEGGIQEKDEVYIFDEIFVKSVKDSDVLRS